MLHMKLGLEKEKLQAEKEKAKKAAGEQAIHEQKTVTRSWRSRSEISDR